MFGLLYFDYSNSSLNLVGRVSFTARFCRGRSSLSATAAALAAPQPDRPSVCTHRPALSADSRPPWEVNYQIVSPLPPAAPPAALRFLASHAPAECTTGQQTGCRSSKNSPSHFQPVPLVPRSSAGPVSCSLAAHSFQFTGAEIETLMAKRVSGVLNRNIL